MNFVYFHLISNKI